MRRGLAIAAIGVGALLVLLMATWLWLFHSTSGRDFALARVQAALGADRWSLVAADGTLAGPLALRGVDYRLDDGTRIGVDTLRVDLAPAALLRRGIDIDTLAASGVVIDLPARADGAEPSAWELPDRLPWPQLELPLSIAVDDVDVRGLTIQSADSAPITFAMLQADLLWPRGDALQIRRLHATGSPGELVAQGTLRLDGVPDAELQASLQPAAASEALTLDARTVDERLHVRIGVPGSGEVRIELAAPFDYRLDIALDDFVVARWFGGDTDAGPPIDLTLQASGDAQQAALQGRLARGELDITIEPSQVQFDRAAGRVHLVPLLLRVGEHGRVHMDGGIVLDSRQLDLQAKLDGLQWPLVATEADATPVTLDGTLQLTGTPDALAIALDGELARAALQAELSLQALLDSDALRIERIALAQPAGRLLGRGTVGWQPTPHWNIHAELQAFDPGVLAEALAGRLDGELDLRGSVDEDGGVALALDVDDLHGTLRGRPLQVAGRAALRPDGRGSADLAARIGASRIRIEGDPGERRDLRIALDPLHLGDLLPEAAGTLRGTLRLHGSGDAARVAGTLRGAALAFDAHRVGRADAEFDAALDLRGDNTLRLRLADAELQGEAIDRLELDVGGGLDGLVADLDASGPRLALSGQWRGRRDGERWVGQLQRLQASATGVPTLTLEQPAPIRIGPEGIVIDEHCLAAADGRTCVSFRQRGGEQQFDISLDALPLALLDPWLAFGDRAMRLDGRLSGQVALTVVDGQPQRGTVVLRSPDGALHWLAEPVRQIIEWQALQVDGRLQDGRLHLSAQSGIDDGGRLDLRLTGPSPLADRDTPTVDGHLQLVLPEVRLLSLLPDTVVAPRGRLEVDVRAGGAWQAPQLSGSVELLQFSAEIPALGIQLADATLALRGDRQRLTIDGRASSGGSPLSIDGTIDSPLDAPQAQFTVRGDRVLLADTPLVRAVASPDLQAGYDGDRLTVRGRIALPTARLALERIEQTEPISNDVVVLDPQTTREQATPLPIDADLQVELGSEVAIEGFGFDGGLSGTLRIRERPGRPTTARGSLAVRGEYTAYGQDLEIERGRLVYSNTALDDPALDLRVAREVRDQRVGLNIRGSARDPTLEVWSEGDTTLDQGEALSLLLFGRPLSTAGDADSEQLTDAALAVGGNLLAARLGARLGFDTFELASSDSLGGTAFTVGKYLSPRLHIAYGVSLFGSGQVLSLSYAISELFEFKLETGEASRGSLNYRIER